MKLTTRSKVKAHLGIPRANTSKDSIIDQIIDGVSGFIETQTHRTFEIKEYTEIMDGTRYDEIFLKEYPLRDVLTLKIDGVEIDLDAEEEADSLIIDKEVGSIWRDNGFTGGRKSLRVTYEAGYNLPEENEESGSEESGATGEYLPDAIEAAAIRLSARVYERRTAEGVSSVSGDSMSVNYKDAVDSDVISIIEAHTKRRV